jgi:hypothetical protein
MSGQSDSDGMTKRLVRATVASAASGLIAYGLRKAAPILREKLQSLGEAKPAGETLSKAKDVVSEKVGAATSAVSDRIGQGSSSSASSGGLSSDDLEQRHKERAKHRQARQKTAAN